MDSYTNTPPIIPRVPGPGGIMVSDTKRVFSHLWQCSKDVIEVIEKVKQGKLTPENAFALFFEGGSKDPVFRCFLILVSINNEATLELFSDLCVMPKKDCVYDSIDDAYACFFTDMYAKESVCCGRHDQGRKKPRSPA